MRKTLILAGALALVAAPALADASTTVDAGSALATIVNWIAVAFGGTIASVVTWAGVRGLKWMGVQLTDAQKSQLQAIVVNGVNDAASRAQDQLRANPALAIDLKRKVVADAVSYVQRHGADTIQALGLDPNSGEAVEAIKARVATAIADPNTPTDPAITPVASGGVAK